MKTISFGSDEFLQLLRPDPFDYEPIYPIVDAAIRPFVYKRVKDDDAVLDDLLQEIHIAVWQQLPHFLARAEDYAPAQRRSWLYTIAQNKINDAFHEMTRLRRESGELNESLAAPCSDPEELLCRDAREKELEHCVDTLLRTACSTRSRPENKLAFLYNRVIMPLSLEHARKGDNKEVSGQLSGRPLGEIRARVESDLSCSLGRKLPDDLFESLDKSLAGREFDPFDLTTHQIATASYTICSALTADRKCRTERDALELSPESAYGLWKNSDSLIIHGRFRYTA